MPKKKLSAASKHLVISWLLVSDGFKRTFLVISNHVVDSLAQQKNWNLH